MANLKKYTITELNLMLKRVEEMIVIPIVNRFNLNKEELIEMIDKIFESNDTLSNIQNEVVDIVRKYLS